MISILLADDHEIVRQGLRLLLEGHDDLTVVAECETGLDAAEQVDALEPDVVLMDISMPKMDGATATGVIVQRHPGIKVLVLTMHDEPQRIREMIACGAVGYVTKTANPEELVSAVRAVMAGQYYIQTDMAGAVVHDILGASHQRAATLSAREQDVVRLVAQGLSTAEIADELVLSPRTVQTHRYNAMRKLGLHNGRELTLYAVRTGLVASG
jgi:DNA-binding NarL/FixJ family response regulator